MMVFIIASTFTHAQSNVLISDDDWTLTSSNGACNCATNFNNGSVTNFFDSGNNTNSYSSNENEVITLCPDASGSKMVAVFGTNAGYTLDIHTSDTLFVYDGIQTTSTLLAKINNSTFPNGVNLPASWSNTSGCLTFQFISDVTNEGSGWEANLSCANLIQPFSNHILAFVNGEANGANDTLNDLFPVDTGYVDICLGDTVTFVADPYFPYEPGGDSASISGGGYMQSNNYTVLWELSDGTTYSSNSFDYIPSSRNGVFISLRIEDSQGQFQYSFCKVRVSTVPNFSSCAPLDSPICLGNTTQLIGGVTTADTAGVDPVSANFPIGGVFGTQTYLPDGSGINYTTDINSHSSGNNWHGSAVASVALGAYNNNAKTKHIIPVNLSKKNYNKVNQIAFKAHKLLKCKGITRSDFKFYKNKFYLLEINTQPGMTSLSLVPEIAKHCNISFESLVNKILSDASLHK